MFLSVGVPASILAGGDEFSGRKQTAEHAEYAEGETGGIVRPGS
jgi:hypothetical protein